MAQDRGMKEQEIMHFLHMKVFDPILQSQTASINIKTGVRYTIMRLEKLDAKGMVQYFWSAISGTERSQDFADKMKNEGFVRFEDVRTEFLSRFDPSTF